MIRRLLWIGVLVLAPTMALAQDHPLHGVALVIGESKYEQLPQLVNPQKDARDIDRLLGDLGFDVDRVLNANGTELREAIDRFTDEAKGADIALVYYSGHGIETKGENFLAPTDTDISTPQAAGASMIAVQPILEALSKAAPVTIVLLDACRSDPFPPGQLIELPGDPAPTPVAADGLAATRGPTPVAQAGADPASLGEVIGFAAEPGEPALDGAPGENSPYAAALLKHLGAGGYSFGDVMTMVTEEVYLKTKAQQLPWTNSSLRRVLTFASPDEDQGDADQQAIKTERRKLLLSIASTPEPTQKYVESLAGQEKVPLDALYGMLDVLGIKAGDDNGDLQDQLQKGAERLKELVAEGPPPVQSDAELERLSKLADDAESEGAIALALKYRNEASARADTLLGSKQAEAAQLKQDMVDIAGTYAANAATATLNFDHVQAAALFGKAFDAVKDWDAAKALDFKISQGDALADEGYYVADNAALTSALEVYGEALALAPRDSDPANWGKVRDRIGEADGLLGARTSDKPMLLDAVAAFNDALSVETETAMPDRWAAVENNVGNVLYDIGAQTDDQVVLQQSIDAFDASLRVYTRAANPVRWATAQSNRGGSEIELAHAIYAATDNLQGQALEAGNKDAEHLPEVMAARDKSVAILDGVVSSLQEALVARPRSDSPLDWALIQHTLAGALSERAKLTDSADDFRAATAAFRAVLEVHDKVRTPAQWARSAANLAATLRSWSASAKDPTPLAEAADLLQQSIELTPRGQAAADWAELESKLGNVWGDMFGFDGKPETADKAVAAYQAAEEVTTADANLDAWAGLELDILDVQLRAGTPTHDIARMKQARDTAATAAGILKARGNSQASYFEPVVPALDQYIAAFAK